MAEALLLDQLIDALKCLPGVGKKTAQRMALHLLERDRGGAQGLVRKLSEALEKIGHCTQCRTLTEFEVCHICTNPRRDRTTLCTVESPTDVLAIEKNTDYRGLYFVLMGKLSPLDGIGPEELGLDKLESRLDAGEVRELILAMSATVEGEVTAHVLSGFAHKRQIKVTRLAQGIPVGGELEYLDASTLTQAITGRREY